MRQRPEERQPKPNMIARALDAFIGTLSPRRGAQRLMARSVAGWLAAEGGYRSARHNRLNSEWHPMDGSADDAILNDLPTLRARSQDAVRNNSDAASAVSTMVTNVVANGIRLQSRVSMADGLPEDGITEEMASAMQKACEVVFYRWQPWADAAGRLDFFEMQAQVERAMLVDGEVLAIRQMIDMPGRPYKTAVELVEPARLGTPIDMMSDKSIRGGVKIGEHGEPMGYWIMKPQANGLQKASSDGYTYYEKMDPMTGMANVLHLYHQDRPGQSRGVPMLSSQLDLIEHIERYVEAEVVAARSAACSGIIITTPDPYSAAAGNATILQTGTDGTERIENLQPNMVQYLMPGQDMKTFQVDRPGTQFEGFLSVMQRRFGSAWGLPDALISKDFSKANYSSMRAALLQAYRLFRYRQSWLSRKFCQPVYEWVLQEAAAMGQLPVDAATFVNHLDIFCAAQWVPPGWEWIDPLKEATAAEKSMGNYLSNLVQEAATRGLNWEHILEDAARVMSKMGELELPTPKVFQGGTSSTATQSDSMQQEGQ